MNTQQVKYALRTYLQKRTLPYRRMVCASPVWGPGAKANTLTLTKGRSDTKAAAERILFPATQPHIIQTPWKWAHALGHRDGNPPGIVWHNAAGNGPASGIHAYHISLGWSGIAYHYYVRKDGSIWAGRPEWAMGGHCLGHNDWLGICAEGNYETVDKVMPAAQQKSLTALHKYLHAKYHGIPDKKHKDMSGNSTSCPGRYYPFDAITK